jgi:hypothetical protein
VRRDGWWSLREGRRRDECQLSSKAPRLNTHDRGSVADNISCSASEPREHTISSCSSRRGSSTAKSRRAKLTSELDASELSTVIRRRDLTLVNGNDHTVVVTRKASATLSRASSLAAPLRPSSGRTHLKKPTPNPLRILPNTMTLNPVVKVWNMPPMVKMRAPARRVLRRPKTSPTRPDRREVTVREFEEGQSWCARGTGR